MTKLSNGTDKTGQYHFDWPPPLSCSPSLEISVPIASAPAPLLFGPSRGPGDVGSSSLEGLLPFVGHPYSFACASPPFLGSGVLSEIWAEVRGNAGVNRISSMPLTV